MTSASLWLADLECLGTRSGAGLGAAVCLADVTANGLLPCRVPLAALNRTDGRCGNTGSYLVSPGWYPMPAVATGILVSGFSRKCWTIGITFSCSEDSAK